MDYFTKRNVLIWALIMLVVLNISTLVTIWIINRSADTPVEAIPPADFEFRGVNHFIKNELVFSENQWQEFTDLRQQNMLETRQLMQELHGLRQEMFEELASENPNERKMAGIAQKMGDTHSALKLNSMQFFTDVNKLCDAEQKQKLNMLYQELKNMPEHRGYGQPERQHRKRHRLRNQRSPQ